MSTIYGTDGNDDGTTMPVLRSLGSATTIFGLGGNDVLISASRPFDETPDVLHGGTGNDRYILGSLGVYFIYSTPIIQVLFEGDVVIHEIIRAEDSADTADLSTGIWTINANFRFDGTDLWATGWAGLTQEVRMVDNYGVDAAGNLLAGVDHVIVRDYYANTLVPLDLKLADPLLGFVRNGTAGNDAVTGTSAGNVIDGRDGDDLLNGLDGNDFLTGGTGNDVIHGDGGNDRAFGGDGDDQLFGGAGDDQLSGMRGADILAGGAGNDRYIFDGLGNGVDVIADSIGADDSIVFGAGIGLADLLITNDGNDLVVALAAEPGAAMRIVGQSAGLGGRIERLQFADGSSLDLGALYNAAPQAADDAFAIVQDRVLTGNLIADNGGGVDRDPDGDALSLTAQTLTSAGGAAVTIAADGSFQYTAVAGFIGSDSFTYTLLDRYGAADTAVVNIVVAANAAPVARNDAFVGTEDRPITGNLFADNGSGVDSDANGDGLVANAGIFATANGGRITVLANGQFTYVPRANFSGTDSFIYSVGDGFGLAATATARFNLAPVNDAPDAVSDFAAGSTLTVLTGNLLANDSDADGDALSALAGRFTTAGGGNVAIAANGTFTYQSQNGHVGSDSFTYTISDGRGGSDSATVMLNLSAPSRALLGTYGDDTLLGTALADTILAQQGNDDIDGGNGSDKLYGGAGDDRIYGGYGNDLLFGGDGDDRLFGGAGADRLYGGRGNDTLKGDAGADVFVFDSLANGIDTISGFRVREADKIDLTGLFEGSFNRSVDAITDFVRITQIGTNSFLDVDLDGAGSAFAFSRIAMFENVIGLTNEQALLNSGIIVI